MNLFKNKEIRDFFFRNNRIQFQLRLKKGLTNSSAKIKITGENIIQQLKDTSKDGI